MWTPGLRFVNSGRLFTSQAEEVDIGPGEEAQYPRRYYGYTDLAISRTWLGGWLGFCKRLKGHVNGS